MNETIMQSLQAQLNRERLNAEKYRQFGYMLNAVNWQGSAKFMHKAAEEEIEHACKFAAWIISNGGIPRLGAIPDVAPVADVVSEDLLTYFAAAYAVEQENTRALKVLYFEVERAEEAQTCAWLQPFLIEQAESEQQLMDICAMLRRIGNDGRVAYDAQIGSSQ